jgi:hypothetical protein
MSARVQRKRHQREEVGFHDSDHFADTNPTVVSENSKLDPVREKPLHLSAHRIFGDLKKLHFFKKKPNTPHLGMYAEILMFKVKVVAEPHIIEGEASLNTSTQDA